LIAFSSFTPARCLAQWIVENDHPDAFDLIITPLGDNATRYSLKADGNGQESIARIGLGTEKHAITSINRSNGITIYHNPQDLGRLARRGRTRMKQIVTPVGETRDGTTIYQAMPDFPASNRHEELLKDLQRSRWIGTFKQGRGEYDGYLNLNGQNGSATDRTTLSGIEYVPGDIIYVTGQWKHRGQEGEITLTIAPENPWYLEGYYRNEDGSGNEGVAWRAERVDVVVVGDAVEIKSGERVVELVEKGDRLVIHKATKHWCRVSHPGGEPIGWIQPKFLERR
jgi:hypothetical protein